MSNPGAAVLSLGILSGVGYAIYRAKIADRAAISEPVLISYTPAPAPARKQKSTGWKQVLLGGLLGAIGGGSNSPGQIANSTGGESGLGGFLAGVFGGGAANSGHSPTSTDYGIVPFGQTEIGHRLKIDLMQDFGFSNNQAAGIVGNLHVETAGFSMLQEIQPMEWRGGVLVPSSTAKGGYGYAQWTGPRRRAFERWAAQSGFDVSSYRANYGFLKYEMTQTSERRVVGKLRSTSTVAAAARVFEITYLRPGIPNSATRAAFAERYA